MGYENQIPPEIVVAGHVCLDIIPSFEATARSVSEAIAPGKLVQVSDVTISTGGAVANTGLALHRLGISTRLLGKIGNDIFGDIIINLFNQENVDLGKDLIISADSTSYSIVLNIPGSDRAFLHNSGANDTFAADDIHESQLQSAKIFHFGYPPLMRRIFQHEGNELVQLLNKTKNLGVTTSLDMAYPDPVSEAGLVNWRGFFANTLPLVDVFLPSLDEVRFMLGYSGENEPCLPGEIISEIADDLMEMGPAMVVLKLGDQGLYLRTTDKRERLLRMGNAAPDNPTIWIGRELLIPCFSAEVVGTTGAGDSTIAGFLAGLVKQLSPEQVIIAAVAVGSFNVESSDAISGIPNWNTVQQRIQEHPPQRKNSIILNGWKWNEDFRLWTGPHDLS